MRESIKKLSNWLFSLGPRERTAIDAADKLQMSMRTTAKCRYNASVRLQHQGKFAFFTTTVLSLGLVFIPLMQNAGVPLALQPNVLNMMLIFLAVSVLVYSVVIGTARYEVRAEQLTECGNKLKELTRELSKEREANGGKIDPSTLAEFQQRYSDIVTDVENHSRNDYRFALLEMIDDCLVTGLVRLKIYAEGQFVRALSYVLPGTLIMMEMVFISDMMGATNVLAPYLNGAVVAEKLGLPASSTSASAVNEGYLSVPTHSVHATGGTTTPK